MPHLAEDDAPALVARLSAIAAEHGIERTGVAPATVLERARRELLRRRAEGLHDGMQFTYKHPERSTDPSAAVRGARSVFVGARSYLVERDPGERADVERADVERIGTGSELHGRIARYAWADHYAPLRTGLWAVAHELRSLGWRAVAFADDNSMVDREVAHLAGLGWFGKNANLLLDGVGSWFVLGSVVTDAPLPHADTLVADGCGACRRCLDACPTGAIVAPGVIDAARCLAWVLQKPGVVDPQLRRAVGDRLYGCDDCQEVCPPTVRLGRRSPAPNDLGELTTHVDVLDLLDADDDEVMRRWGRWYLADRNPSWVRRNAYVVLGNAVESSRERLDPTRVTRALAAGLAHRDPMVRAHAVWAARRWGADRLLPVHDPDPVVRAELDRTEP